MFGLNTFWEDRFVKTPIQSQFFNMVFAGYRRQWKFLRDSAISVFRRAPLLFPGSGQFVAFCAAKSSGFCSNFTVQMHRCPFWLFWSQKWMAIPGLPGGLIIYQGCPSISSKRTPMYSWPTFATSLGSSESKLESLQGTRTTFARVFNTFNFLYSGDLEAILRYLLVLWFGFVVGRFEHLVLVQGKWDITLEHHQTPNDQLEGS